MFIGPPRGERTWVRSIDCVYRTSKEEANLIANSIDQSIRIRTGFVHPSLYALQKSEYGGGKKERVKGLWSESGGGEKKETCKRSRSSIICQLGCGEALLYQGDFQYLSDQSRHESANQDQQGGKRIEQVTEKHPPISLPALSGHSRTKTKAENPGWMTHTSTNNSFSRMNFPSLYL